MAYIYLEYYTYDEYLRAGIICIERTVEKVRSDVVELLGGEIIQCYEMNPNPGDEIFLFSELYLGRPGKPFNYGNEYPTDAYSPRYPPMGVGERFGVETNTIPPVLGFKEDAQ